MTSSTTWYKVPFSSAGHRANLRGTAPGAPWMRDAIRAYAEGADRPASDLAAALRDT